MMLTSSAGYVFSAGQPVVSSAGLLLPGQSEWIDDLTGP